MVSPYICSTCSRKFSSNSHLRRHEASHTSGRSYSCFFCERKFTRIDVARRHATKCPQRGDQPMPQSLKRGKPKSSCDYCTTAKVACDEDTPCGTCVSNSLTCTYTRLGSPPSGQDRRAGRRTTKREMAPASPECADASQKARIPFLLNFYNANNYCRDFYSVLESGRPQIGRRGESPIEASESAGNSMEPPERMLFMDDLGDFPFFGLAERNTWKPESQINEVSHGFDAQAQTAAMEERVADVVKELRLAAERSGQSVENGKARLDAAIHQGLFSVPNFMDFTRLYLQRFRRHCPIVDLPFSRIPSISLPLLVAIFLGGSIISYPRDTYDLALDCFDLAEEYIFGLPIFQTGCKDHGAPEERLPELAEPLVAAIIIILIQIGRNDPKIRRRIRCQRFSSLIYAARLLSLFRMSHRESTQQAASSGLDFRQKESLIRTAAFILLLDCQFVACARTPPLLTIAEMTGDLPCNEVQFYMEEPLSNPAYPSFRESLSLVKVIDALMDISQEKLQDLYRHSISIFALFAVICGLNATIFSACASRSLEIQLPQFKRALSRWKLLWGDVISRSSRDELALVGFMTSAEEIWLLARALLQMDPEDFVRGLDCDSMAPLQALLRRAHQMAQGPAGDLDP